MFQLTKIITKLPTLAQISTKKSFFFKNVSFFSETSRDIEQKMRLERMKNVENKFKSINTYFGLRRPS